MTSNAQSITPTVPVSAVASDVGITAEQPAKVDPVPNQRLVIEEGPTQGSFVYKTVDRTTGEVIRQFPREELIKLIRSDGYQAGTFTDLSA